jgi:uncharacterized delta-60 repeat protein
VEALEERRMLAVGSLDPSFDIAGTLPGTVLTNKFFDATDRNEEARSIAVQPDGKIVVGGFTSNGSNDDFALARYTSAGVLDSTFGGGDGKVFTPIGANEDRIYAIAIQADGKIVAVGRTWNGSNYDIAVARYTSTGVLDTTFNATGVKPGVVTTDLTSLGVDDEAFAVALQGNDIVVAGRLRDLPSSPQTYDFFVTRYIGSGVNAGKLDNFFNNSTGYNKTEFSTPDQDDQAYSLVVNVDQTIIVGGWTFSVATNSYDFAMAKYTSSGTLVTSGFGTNGKVVTNFGGSSRDEAYGLAVQPGGKIVVVGRTQATAASSWTFGLARYNVTGVLDSTFDGDGLATTDFGAGDDEAYSVVLQPADGKIVVAGISNGDFAVARYMMSEGSPDVSFDGDGRATTSLTAGEDKAFDVALQADGKIVVAGYGTIGANNRDFAVARYIANDSSSGDYNQNHIVDAADYVLWRNNLNASVTPFTNADGSGNGLVDPADYTVWRSRYGQLPGAGSVEGVERLRIPDFGSRIEEERAGGSSDSRLMGTSVVVSDASVREDALVAWLSLSATISSRGHGHGTRLVGDDLREADVAYESASLDKAFECLAAAV